MRSDKTRDMVRSILPSKNREAAGKAKRCVKRAVRRTIRHDLLHFDTTNRDLLRDARIDVWWRRTGDKLNHFMRWCERITRGMKREDALSYVRRLLPRNVIGDHAYSHWESHLRPGFRWRDTRAQRQQSVVDRTRHRLRRAMETEPDLLGRLNASIKSLKAPGEPRRLLRGIHDVDDFIREIFAGEPPAFCWPEAWAIERKAVAELI